MVTPPKRPTKKTTPAKKTTSPEPYPRGSHPQNIEELRKGVLALAEQVNTLSGALTTVNKMQSQVAKTEAAAKSNEKRTLQIQENLIPRSEHEKRWKKEQSELIETRLTIRRQTYIVGLSFFLASILALTGVAILIVRDIHNRNVSRCQSSNDYRRGDRELWNEVLAVSGRPHPTPAEIKNRQEFTKFLDKHDALQKC